VKCRESDGEDAIDNIPLFFRVVLSSVRFRGCFESRMLKQSEVFALDRAALQ
jgi:hypothetical protein